MISIKTDNHIMPFLWVHGENEDVYRKMVSAIDDANMKAFCVEARPHEGFCGDNWWRDLDIIFDEAEKRGMRVWILDDKHFPTGYANGGALKAPLELRRQSICNNAIKVSGGKKIKLNLSKYIKPPKPKDMLSVILDKMMNKGVDKLNDDKLFSCTAYSENKYIDLSGFIKANDLEWDAPSGKWTIEICFLSRDVGMHRGYINMLDKQSCRILIDEVYEPHYAHYKDRFGSVIAGFFSDEPELGNGRYCNFGNVLGTPQDLPFSRELEIELKKSLGKDYKNLLPLLWNNDFDKKETARVRFVFMDAVTRLVETNFSKQIGEWCRERGVDYIGHVIEDNNQHARTGSSLGHFYRGLKYQSMSGIDNIGGQVYPGQEDENYKFNPLSFREGEFYHYCLGKLGTSLAAVTPHMKGRTMCEVFGNYGWSEGVRLEKYLVDHFMVRGVNYFVPHAFTCKEYPDKDCPPHFYAMGNNPQYRHFGELMRYTNRVCNLISGGSIDAKVGVLYHGESEWTGKAMLMQKPARVLYDNNIDFHFVPSDIFSEREFYHTEISDEIKAGNTRIKLLVVPAVERITLDAAYGIAEFISNGGKAVFIDSLPIGTCTGESLPEAIKNADVVGLEKLADYSTKLNLQQAIVLPQTNRLRIMHYCCETELYYLFNENNKAFDGTVEIPTKEPICLYDAWNDQYYAANCEEAATGKKIDLCIEPSKALFIIVGKTVANIMPSLPKNKTSLLSFTQSVCRSIDYPNFSKARQINQLTGYEKVDKKFSGFIRYETQIDIKKLARTVLEITDAYEGVEVFVNGQSCGLQVVPSFVFDITKHIKQGKNDIAIEVATTLERERKGKSKSPTGITGEVNLYTEE